MKTRGKGKGDHVEETCKSHRESQGKKKTTTTLRRLGIENSPRRLEELRTVAPERLTRLEESPENTNQWGRGSVAGGRWGEGGGVGSRLHDGAREAATLLQQGESSLGEGGGAWLSPDPPSHCNTCNRDKDDTKSGICRRSLYFTVVKLVRIQKQKGRVQWN